MRVSVVTDVRCEQLPDGSVWSAVPCSSWSNYLQVFEEVNVIARIRPAPLLSPNVVRSDGRCVGFTPVHYYHGPWAYLCNYPLVRRSTKRAVGTEDAVILRVPSQVATCVHGSLTPGRPYGVQVGGDAFEVFGPGVVTHPLRRLFRILTTHNERRQCREAAAASYVTQRVLQARYPCHGPHWAVSDVAGLNWTRLPHDDSKLPSSVAPSGADHDDRSRKMRLVCVGSLEQMYKGPDVLLEALRICCSRRLDLSLTWVGGGLFRERMIRKAATLGLTDRVHFVGQVRSGSEVNHHLEAADVFVLPSRTEGLPRALLEAMSKGLPCVASRVGGIPELLEPDDLAPPGDARALAEKLEAVLSDPVRRRAMGRRNHQKALEFHPDRLERERRMFFRYVYDVTSAWLGGKWAR